MPFCMLFRNRGLRPVDSSKKLCPKPHVILKKSVELQILPNLVIGRSGSMLSSSTCSRESFLVTPCRYSQSISMDGVNLT